LFERHHFKVSLEYVWIDETFCGIQIFLGKLHRLDDNMEKFQNDEYL